jgi:DNA-binding GntR family transcriptional regulator
VRVVEFRIEDFLDIYAMRSVLESLAASTAAQIITEAQLQSLRTLQNRMSVLHDTHDLPEIRTLNQEFHLQIVDASDRKYLIRTLRAIWTWFPTMLWSQIVPDAEYPHIMRDQDDNREHGQILAALETHDSAAAEQAMRQHIENSRRTLTDYMKHGMQHGTPA